MTAPRFSYRRLVDRGLGFARAELAAVAALAVALLGALSFAEIAGEVAEREEGFDQAVLASLRVGGDPRALVGPGWLHQAAEQLTNLGDSWVLMLITAIVVGFLLIQKRPIQALFLLIALVGGTLLSEGLKEVFARERPAAAYRIVEVTSRSFPSGHAMLSAVAYLTLGAMLARVMSRRRLKVYVLAVAVGLAVMIGLTRIYLGVHWTTDVIGGWALGSAWAMACWLAAYAIERWRGRAARAAGAPAPAEEIPNK